MAITVQTGTIEASNPIVLTLQDKSGAHVTLTACIKGLPPLSHSFSYSDGEFTANVPTLPPGNYPCSFIVQAFQYGALNGMYRDDLLVNGKCVAFAQGNIPPSAGFDAGYGVFNLVVH